MRHLILFLKIVWREWEPKGTIPDPYRIKYRIPIKMAWEISKI
jgi:hypothetical protein